MARSTSARRRSGLAARPLRGPRRLCRAACPCCSSYLRSQPRARDRCCSHDVHERLAPIDAVAWPGRSSRTDLFFLEDPLAPEDQEWFRTLRQHSVTPIAMGELFTHPLEWRPLIVEGLIDFIRVHLSDIGGITPARKLAALAEAFGVRTAFHGPGDVSPVGHAANVHLDVTLPNFGVQELWGFDDALAEVFPGCPEVRDGCLFPNDEPGLGIDVDEQAGRQVPASTRTCTSSGMAWWTGRSPGCPTARSSGHDSCGVRCRARQALPVELANGRSGLGHRVAAVDGQHDARDEGRLVGCQEQHRAGHLLGPADATQGVLADGLAHLGVRILDRREVAAEQGRVDGARGDGVDADAPGGEVGRHRASHGDAGRPWTPGTRAGRDVPGVPGRRC